MTKFFQDLKAGEYENNPASCVQIEGCSRSSKRNLSPKGLHQSVGEELDKSIRKQQKVTFTENETLNRASQPEEYLSNSTRPAFPVKLPEGQHRPERISNSVKTDSTILGAHDGVEPQDRISSLPAFLEEILNFIKEIASYNSKISTGAPDDLFSQTFSKPFTPPNNDDMEDGFWDFLDQELNLVIGIDVCHQHIRRGRFGADGLLQSWIEDRRQFNLWDSQINWLILPKLERVHKILQISLCLPQLGPNRSQLIQNKKSSSQKFLKAQYLPADSSLAKSSHQPPVPVPSRASSPPAILHTVAQLDNTSVSSRLNHPSHGKAPSIVPLHIPDPKILANVTVENSFSGNCSENDTPDLYGSMGTSIKVSRHVFRGKKMFENEERSAGNQDSITIWKGSILPPVNIQLIPTSLCKNKLENGDCKVLLLGCLRILAKREKASQGINYDSKERLPDGTSFSPKSRLGLRKWLAQKPS